jgi:hypothetical protein
MLGSKINVGIVELFESTQLGRIMLDLFSILSLQRFGYNNVGIVEPF